MKKVIVTKLSRAIRHVVSRGAQGPRGGLWAGWADIPDKPDFDALYDPLGAASAAQSAAAADATAKVNAHEGAVDPHAQYALDTDLSGHTGDMSNPHNVTKDQVGLGNVDNTSDESKPVSTAQQNALNGKEPTIAAGTSAQFWRGDKTWADFAANVRMTVLTGLSTASASVITAADSVLGAIGKLQAQISDVITQTEAETGTSTTRRSWTAQRVRQATAAWWEAVKGTLTGPVAITANSASDALRVTQTGSGNALVVEDSASPDSSPFVITGAGNVVVGATAPRNIGVTPMFSVEGLGSSATTMLITRNSADTSPCTFRAVKSRGAANGALDAIGSADSILQFIAYGTDGTGHDQAASVTFAADGPVSTGIVPGKIIFYTANSAGVLTEVFRIDSSQVLALTSGKLKLALNAGATKLLQSDASGNAAWGPEVGQADAALPTNSDLRAYYGVKYKPSIKPTLDIDWENSYFAIYNASTNSLFVVDNWDAFATYIGADLVISRAGEQTYFDALGRMRVAAANTLQCDHDPLTGKKLGPYIGAARTNLCRYSADHTQWTVADATLDAETWTAPDGTAARIWTASTAVTTHRLSRTTNSATVGTSLVSYSWFVYIPPGSDVQRLYLRARSTTGGYSSGQAATLGVTGSGASAAIAFIASAPFGANPPSPVTAANVTVQALGGGVFRLCVTGAVNSDAAALSTVMDIAWTAGNTESIAGTANTRLGVWGWQYEVGGSISPYIPVPADTAVTRPATTVTIGGTKFAGLFGFTEVTLVAKAIAADVMTATDRRICMLSDGTVNNRFSLHINGSSIRVYANASGAFLYGPSVGTAFAGVPFSVALSGKSGLYAAACKGVAAAEGLVSGFGAFNRVQIGYGVTSQQFDGWVQAVTVYPRALTTSQDTELSK